MSTMYRSFEDTDSSFGPVSSSRSPNQPFTTQSVSELSLSKRFTLDSRYDESDNDDDIWNMGSKHASKYYYCGILIDIMAALISVIDVGTDVIVLIGYYLSDRMIFFWISLSILSLAQCSYIIAYYVKYGAVTSIPRTIISILFTIPFAPILSFVLLFSANPNSCLSKFISSYMFCCDVSFKKFEFSRIKKQSPFQEWINHEILKHIGFILESLVEALPQSVLQLVAIIYFKDSTNTIIIASMFVSIFSVCSKTLILSLGLGSKTKYQLFFWFCCMTDLFGIFFISSFAFYSDPRIENIFLNIAIWEIIICIIPFVIVASFGLFIYGIVKLKDEVDSNNICILFGIFLMMLLLSTFGFFILLLVMYIFTTLWITIILIVLGFYSRIEYDKLICNLFYGNVVDWILSETGNKKRLLRICCVNRVFTKNIVKNRYGLSTLSHDRYHYRGVDFGNRNDIGFREYVKKEEKTCFRNVTFSKLRSNSSYLKETEFIKAFFYQLYGSLMLDYFQRFKIDNYNICRWNCIASGMLSYLFCCAFPIYFISKLLRLCFPIFIAIYLYFMEDVLLFVDHGLFQVVMWSLYVSSVIITFYVLFIHIVMDEYYLWHILPSSPHLEGTTDLRKAIKKFNEIKLCYNNVISDEICRKLLTKLFGIDITIVVMQYYDDKGL